MFSKKVVQPSSNKPRNKELENMLGLGIPNYGDDGDDDDSLLAELAALEGKSAVSKKKKVANKKVMSMGEIDNLAAFAARNIDSENEDEDDDVDENDLLAELSELTENQESQEEIPKETIKSNSSIGKLISERKQMYTIALTNAKAEGASSKVRRFERALKDIDTLMKKVSAGAVVNEDDIPPPVATGASKSLQDNAQLSSTDSPVVLSPVVPQISTEIIPVIAEKYIAPEQPVKSKKLDVESQSTSISKVVESPEYSNATLEALLTRQKEFKIEALKSKQQGDIESARNYLAISKKFDAVIEALKSGKEVDLRNMPESASIIKPTPTTTHIQELKQESSVPSSSEAVKVNDAPPAPVTIMDALLQRLEKYQSSLKSAEEENNTGKARRMGRIVKQYKDAIENFKKNIPIDYNELPVPPGFAPIPGVTTSVEEPESTPQLPAPQMNPQHQSTLPAAAPTFRNQKEYEFLVNRQKEFKMAALNAKKEGDIESAREYLKQAKGLDQMVVAAQNGLRVDVTTVPQVKLKNKSGIKNEPPSNYTPKETALISGSAEDKYMIIENALRKQIEASEKNAEHYKLLGNLDAAKNFESLLKSSKKDLETLLQYKAQGSIVPNCEYQMQSFPIVRSNPHLSDSELEINIIRCINVPMPAGWQPKDMHIYVTFEFPIPKEKPQTGCTTTKKDTINPEFNETFKVAIDRKNQSFVRLCKRQSLVVKVNHVRGFLKADKTIGQGFIKLERFSNRCEIHESVDLMDIEKGRKSVGGKIEVLLKIREPFVDKDAEIVTEKWLVLDTHLRGLIMNMPSSDPIQNSSKVSTAGSKICSVS
ncbi:coiled-coil and C2 domain-containing protein 1-like isoform X5 [Hydra vulgaris]|uniref:Coiled-coil and C2 domain-containing protein 1-like isoform X5 n=1 Tax=Hydra vulgaris TaxID=6087 RepID=A0ABM4D3L6_HYDVU